MTQQPHALAATRFSSIQYLRTNEGNAQMVQTNPQPTPTQISDPSSDRIVPFRRGGRFPRHQPHPDLTAIVLVGFLVADFIDRAWHIAAAPRISYVHVAALFAVYFIALWCIWRLSQSAVAYYDANPWIRRGKHQHKQASDDHDLYYHNHGWAFPFHKHILRHQHKRDTGK